MRKLLSLVALVALAAAAWWYYTTTPEYAVSQIRQAIKSHDVALFERYVDSESVASGVVDTLFERPLGDIAGGSIVGRLVGMGIMSMFKPAVTAHIRKEILKIVGGGGTSDGGGGPSGKRDDGGGEHDGRGPQAASGGDRASAPAFGGRLSIKEWLRQYGFKGRVFAGIAYVKRQDKSARVGLKLHNEKHDTDLTLELAMRDMGGYFRVYELSNLAEFVSRLIQLEHMGGKSAPQPESSL